MIYPDVTVEEWAEKYGLDLTPDQCRGCGKILSNWTPIATRDFRGVITTPHGCEPKYDHKIYSWVDRAQKGRWSELVGL